MAHGFRFPIQSFVGLTYALVAQTTYELIITTSVLSRSISTKTKDLKNGDVAAHQDLGNASFIFGLRLTE
jgi:hypothetical protein